MHSELSLIEQVKSGKLWDFPGGVHPPERKSLSNSTKIDIAPLSPFYYVPIKQHIGNEGELLVNVGDLVLAGQPLTNAIEGLSLPVHAPTSGVIKEISPHVSAHPSGKPEVTVVIESDNQDTTFKSKPIKDWLKADISTLTAHLQSLGVAGLGGAAFPTYVKTNPHKDIKLLIINAVECEPYITADDVLMRYFADDIIKGINILQHMVQPELVVIAIEDNKPEAIEAIELAVKEQDNIEVKVIPTKYPSGGEKQLIQIITGEQVPSKSIPADIGIVMQNIGTCFAIKEAVIDGKALTSRVVTITGESFSRPQNLWVKLGAPISDLLTHCGLVAEEDQRLIMGGPMMGFNIMDIMMPVVKSTNCILAPSEYNLPSFGVEQACIRCSLCSDACPVNLLPQQLLWYSKAKDHEKLEEYNLADCIECGACSYVCPSQIPLVQYYRSSKVEIKQEKEDKIKSDKAKERFETRQLRLERDKQARLLKHKESAEKRKNALAKDDGAKDKIAAALARAKAKKAAVDTGESPTEDAQTTNTQDKVAAAIARAKAKKASAETAESPTQDGQTTNTQDKVAAAIARAKAKKQAQADSETTASVDSENQGDSTAAVEAKSEEQIKKDRVAATVARAKAKKLKQEAENNSQDKASESESATTKSAEKVEATAADVKSAEQIKKDKVAATIARAKAKKLKQAAENKEQGESN